MRVPFHKAWKQLPSLSEKYSFTELRVICTTAEGWGLANIWSHPTLLEPVIKIQNNGITMGNHEKSKFWPEIHNGSFVLLWITCSRLKSVTKVHISLTFSPSRMLMLSCEFCIQTDYVTLWATDCTDMVKHLELHLHAFTDNTHTHTYTYTTFGTFVFTIRYC